MLKEEGLIEKVWRQKALVRIQRGSSCGGCEHRGACEILSGKEAVIEVINRLHAQPGDRVEVSLSEHSVLKLSLLVYLLPVVALVVGACITAYWATSLNMDTTLASILGGGLSMGISFYALRRIDRTAADKSEYRPTVTRILPSALPLEPDGSR